MTALLAVLLTITALFVVLILLKNKLSCRICVLCLAVSITWMGLLAAYHAGWFKDGLLLALLMGQSITGIYYTIEKRAPQQLLIFRLPLLLSLLYLFYGILTLHIGLWPFLLLTGLWLACVLIYAYRTNPRFRETANRMIACCGDW